MPIVKFTKENMPKSGEELVAALRQAAENSSPVDDLIEFTQELTKLELKYEMKSEDFYERFQRGEMGDDLDYVHWANTYEFYVDMKADIEHAIRFLEEHAFAITT